ALAGVALAVHFAGWIASLQYTTVAVSTLLVATAPIWTAVYDAVIRRRTPSLRTLCGFAGGAAGLALVVGFNAAAPPIPGHPLFGAALALAGSLAMAIYLLIVRDVRGSLGTRTIVTRTYAWAAIVLVAAAVLMRQGPPALADLPAWGGILGMALVSQLLGHTALNAALRWFSPSAVAFSTLIEPVSAAVLAFFIFGEGVGPAAIAGGVILLAAIGVVLSEERSGVMPDATM
ncbi:MAG: EamA family transporter, partial [Candidatus Tumulicola sp.]